MVLRRRAARHAVPAAAAGAPDGPRPVGGPPTGSGTGTATGATAVPAAGATGGPDSGAVRLPTPGRPPTTGERATVTPHSFPVTTSSSANGRHG